MPVGLVALWRPIEANPMAGQIELDLKPKHIGGNIKWAKKPTCSCGNLIAAIEDDKFVFVSDFVFGEGDDQYNGFYMMPVGADGYLTRSKGVAIENCPWCGDPIRGLKKYPKK